LTNLFNVFFVIRISYFNWPVTT